MGKTQTYEQFRWLKEGRMSVGDVERTGGSSSGRNDEILLVTAKIFLKIVDRPSIISVKL